MMKPNKLNKLSKKIFSYRVLVQLLLLVAVYWGIQFWQTSGSIKGVAPVILDQSVQGDVIDLNKYKSKPVLVYFWAEWCPICKFENSAIEELSKDYQVISVATFINNKEDLLKYIKDENFSMSIVLDEDNEWAKLYKVNAVPTSFMIDSGGNIRFVEKGLTSSIGLRLRMWWLQ